MDHSRRWVAGASERAMELNPANIERALEAVPGGGRLLDLGCDDGSFSLRFAARARAREIHGVEVVPGAVAAARDRGVLVAEADLNGRLPFGDGEFDVVVSNQVLSTSSTRKRSSSRSDASFGPAASRSRRRRTSPAGTTSRRSSSRGSRSR